MFSLAFLFDTLSKSAGTLLEDISIAKLVEFLRLASALKPSILYDQGPSFNPEHIPAILEYNVCVFMARSLGLSLTTIDKLWDALKIVVWKQGAQLLEADAGTRFVGQLQEDCKLAAHMLHLLR
ncbi:hypothetical protein VTO73DRAFT_14168 [Trametes versicolor]